jgi:hypothetical protein
MSDQKKQEPCMVSWCVALRADDSHFCPPHRDYPGTRRLSPSGFPHQESTKQLAKRQPSR